MPEAAEDELASSTAPAFASNGAPSRAARSDWPRGAALAIAALVALLHALNLVQLALAIGCTPSGLACAAGAVPWLTPDSSSYVEVAKDVLARGAWRASYLVRGPGYPWLLALSQRWFGTMLAALWVEPGLAGLAAWSVMVLAHALTGRRAATLGAGLLVAAWPAMLAYAPELLTDAPHAFLAAAALAATLRWRERGGAPRVTLAALGWIGTQALRPTFFFVAALVPCLLLDPRGRQRKRIERLALWIATLLVPGFVVGSNLLQHGVATASAIGPETVSCYAMPRLRAALGEGDFFDIRDAAFARYRSIPFPERIAVQRRDTRELIAAHPIEAALSLLRELRRQLLAPPRPYSRHEWAALYPPWLSLPSWLNASFWLAALAGVGALARRDPALALFLLGSFVGVMVPAATSALIENRLRLPLDLWAMPLIVLALQWLRDRATQPSLPTRAIRGP